jgi:hypothetical protein
MLIKQHIKSKISITVLKMSNNNFMKTFILTRQLLMLIIKFDDPVMLCIH